MSFGLSVTNNSNSVIIDSVYKVMVFSERGQLRITSSNSDTPGYATVNFTKVVTTQEAPQIFVNMSSASHDSCNVFTTMLGGPGNWTGFRLTSGAKNAAPLQSFYVNYVICKYSNQNSVNQFGLGIWDENGSPVFSSSDRVVRYNKFTKNWTVSKVPNVTRFSSNLALDADDYISVSSFDRGINWTIYGDSYSSLLIYDNWTQVVDVLAQTNGIQGRWYYQDTNGTCLTIPVCKFPTDRYYNT